MKMISNKDEWILDLIENFLLKEDLTNHTMRKLADMDQNTRIATLIRLSEREKDNLIKSHEALLAELD